MTVEELIADLNNNIQTQGLRSDADVVFVASNKGEIESFELFVRTAFRVDISG